MHVKSSVKKLVCAKHVAQSNSRSVNFTLSVRSGACWTKAAGLAPGGFLLFCPARRFGSAVKICSASPNNYSLRKEHDQSWHRRRYRLHRHGIDEFVGSKSR